MECTTQSWKAESSGHATRRGEVERNEKGRGEKKAK